MKHNTQTVVFVGALYLGRNFRRKHRTRSVVLVETLYWKRNWLKHLTRIVGFAATLYFGMHRSILKLKTAPYTEKTPLIGQFG